MSEKNRQFLLLIEALKNTNRKYPKTAEALAKEIKEEWEALFPDESMEPISTSTIGRHIKDMKATRYYHIEAGRDGYYNDKFTFNIAEFAIIAQALYRSTTLSVGETKEILNKLLDQTDGIFDEYSKIIHNQLYRTNRAPKRKKNGKALPIIETIITAIETERQISFSYYNWTDKDESRPGLMQEEDSEETKVFTVSPYFIVWESDECYLIGYLEKTIENGRESVGNTEKYLSHFKVAQIANNIRITTKKCASLDCMKEFPRYQQRRTVWPSIMAAKRNKGKTEIGFVPAPRSPLSEFALDRYMRENPYMIHDSQDVIGVQLIFKEEFLDKLLNRFNFDSKSIKAYSTGQYSSKGEELYSALITVQPNEGFYTWLMANVNDVLVAEPAEIRQEVKRRLKEALDQIDGYENRDAEKH